MKNTPIFCLAALGVFALPSTAFAQFQQQNAQIPATGSSSENVDFGDIDLDGDWDAAIADGGDDGNDQNQLYLNRGGAQGGEIGLFQLATAQRFPSQSDDSRDIEFADIDNDGDLDIYVSNTAQISNQGNKWWVNDGGLQGGSLGFYSDETGARWIGIGQAGSSIPAGAILNAGTSNETFIDWSCDCDFGDIDNDGDLDLVHSTYGGAFGGQVPTRIFLNDGDGFFEEFNPSGFQLTTTNIANGQPAIWAEGVHQVNTNNNNGGAADVAQDGLDIDLGDIDGDFDLDLLHGGRDQDPRMFLNRFEENGGVLSFRDISNGSLGSNGNWAGGQGNYEQEFADMDGDGDLDIYGLNWNGFNDRTFRNDGNGVFTIIQNSLPGSGADDNEGDFIDFDNDGDMDLFVANFSGSDKLYRNNGTGTYSLVSGAGLNGGQPSLDADAADVDFDGDYDLMVTEDNFANNKYFENTTQTPDTTASYIPNVENPGNGSASNTKLPLRAQVYDNAPYYITWYNDTTVDVTVDGTLVATVDAMSSQGQIFRAEVPANLVGDVSLTWRSVDEYGNTGNSAPVNYTNNGAGSIVPFGYGAGSQTAGGTFPTLDALSVPFAGCPLYLRGQGEANTAAILAVTELAIPPTPIPGLGTANIAGTFIVLETGSTDANGDYVYSADLPSGLTAGGKVFAQFGTFNGVGINLLATSQGLEIEIQ